MPALDCRLVVAVEDAPSPPPPPPPPPQLLSSAPTSLIPGSPSTRESRQRDSTMEMSAAMLPQRVARVTGRRSPSGMPRDEMHSVSRRLRISRNPPSVERPTRRETGKTTRGRARRCDVPSRDLPRASSAASTHLRAADAVLESVRRGKLSATRPVDLAKTDG